MDQKPDQPDALDRLVRALAWFLGVLALLALLGFCYFYVPKLEANWKDQGVKLGGPAVFLIRISHALVNYFWLFALGAVAAVAVARSGQRRDRRPPD